jgi:thiol-disulfide isomerase/thioredoxin
VQPAPLTPLARLEASLDLDRVAIGTARTPTVVILLASWCAHCRAEIAVFEAVCRQHPHVRWLGLNYKAHEEYDQRGNSASIRALADETPWLRIAPAGDELFAAFGSPPKVPTIFVYDSRGKLVETFDRRDRPAPREQELDDLLRSLE